MLEKPAISEETLLVCLQQEYAISGAQIEFLPLGADPATAVYRAVAADATPYFVKLRTGAFSEIIATLPGYLHDQGVRQVIAPLATRTGRRWASFAAGALIVYPFVAGSDGYAVDLSAAHWAELGAALRRLHTLALPGELRALIPTEAFSPRWRDKVSGFLDLATATTFVDPVAAEVAAFLRANRTAIQTLVAHAARLAQRLCAQTPEFVLCHTDVHAGNLLIGADGVLYIVDWDAPLLAPKERDLMFPGGAQGFRGHSPAQEERLFYRGYGPAPIDRRALAYYRCERIIEDIAVYCEQLLLSTEGGADRAQSLYYLRSNFLPGGTISQAYAALPSSDS